MENNTHLQPVFSICVPTYNRGLAALMMVFTILPGMDDNWELLILDNASDLEVDSYQQIELLAQIDPRLRYVRHASNRGFQGNFLAAFDLAQSPHIMLISDEDYANTDMIRKVLPNLQASPNLAILRGEVRCIKGQRPRNAHSLPNMTFQKGWEALFGFCLTNSYMSGAIYNRQALLQSGVIERLRKGIQRNYVYPHLYLELLTCALFDAAFTEEMSCCEGEEKPTLGNRVMDYTPPYSFGSRVDQFIILRDAMREAISLMAGPFNHKLFMFMYLQLCNRYMKFITELNDTLYAKNNLNLGLLQDSLFQIFGAGVFAYPELLSYEEQIFDDIHKIYIQYKDIKNTSIENTVNF